MDLDIIKDAFTDDPEALLDEIGLEYEKQGHRLTVLCPFHADNHLGNAGIINGRFHCFACNASGDCFSLVRETLGMSFPDAVKFCSQVYGIQLSNEEDTAIARLRLSKKENEALMFPKTSIGLGRILKADTNAYKKIVLMQADKMLKKYDEIIRQFGKRDAEKAYIVCRLIDNWTPNTFVEITRKVQERIEVLKNLKERMK